MLRRLWHLPAEVISEGPAGRVLDIAAAQAVHSCEIAQRGFSCVAMEPAPTMVADARRGIAASGADVVLVRGYAESLPFGNESFDQVICHSAIDHFAEPDRCIREMTRVLRPSGRLVLTFVNYGGAAVRLSRAFYRIDALFRRKPRVPHWFWESPVPHEHTFECTMPVVAEICEQYLNFDRAFGVSIGWQMPGWGWLLKQAGINWSGNVLTRLDQLAQRFPTAADVVVETWTPRSPDAWTPLLKPNDTTTESADAAAAATLRVSGADPVYKRLVRDEADYRSVWADAPGFAPVLGGLQRISNLRFTGSMERTWLHDFADRCPSAERVAVLGLDGVRDLLDWRRARPDTPVDVFELSPRAIAEAESEVKTAGLDRGVEFIRADLNFITLQPDAYDIIWSSGCLHHLINLERLLDQVVAALRPGGSFGVQDYVGESRRQFSAQRLERANRLLSEFPEHLRRDPTATVGVPPLDGLSPFCAARSVEIPTLIRQRFDVAVEILTGYLFPIELYLDIGKIENGESALLERLIDAENDARQAQDTAPAALYGIYRSG